MACNDACLECGESPKLSDLVADDGLAGVVEELGGDRSAAKSVSAPGLLGVHVPSNRVASATSQYLKRSATEAIPWSLPRGCKRLHAPRPGPKNLIECMDWPSDFRRSMMSTDARLCADLNAVLERGVDMFTDFSGVGGAEQALALVCGAASKDGVRHKVCFKRACDISATARQALLLTDEHVAPHHVLENVLDRLPDDTRQRLDELQAEMNSKLETIFMHIDIKKEASRRHAVSTCGKQLVRRACAILGATAWKNTSYCSKCDCQCPVHHSDPRGGAGRLQLYVAGTTCVHFSAMGLRTCFASDSCIPMLVWLFDSMRYADMLIHENVFGYYGGVILDILKQDFVCTFRAFSPSDLGMPANRPRIYLVATRKTRFASHPLDLQLPLFERIFFRQQILEGRVCFVASADEVRAMKLAFLADRHGQGLLFGFGAGDIDDLAWDDVLESGMAVRLSEYRALAQTKALTTSKPIVNLAQNANHFSMSGFVPTLLQASFLFCMHPEVNRPMTPLECFTVMGIDAHGVGQHSCHLARFFSCAGVPAKKLRSLAGNGMHLAAAGSVLMYALATALPAQV